MTGLAIRKWYVVLDEASHEGGPELARPTLKGAVGVVFANPFAGRFEPDLSSLTEASRALGAAIGERAVALLGGRPVEGYGKGGIAGANGEQEHVVACITTTFAETLRAAVGGGVAWMSSNTKVGGTGTSIDLPLAYKDALYVRSHYDTVTFCVPDAPRPDELLIAVSVSSGGRPHHRVGGLALADAVGEDGLR